MKLRRGKQKQARRALARRKAPPVPEPQHSDLSDLSDEEIIEALDRLDRLGFLAPLGLTLDRKKLFQNPKTTLVGKPVEISP